MANSYSVVLDASVLSKDLHRHVLLNLARAQCFRPVWSETILTETELAVTKQGRNGKKVRMQLETAFESALADPSYIHLVRNINLPDEDDRHVAAVALQEGTDAICTDNEKDFDLSSSDLRLQNVDILTSDEFIADTIDLAPVNAIAALASMRRQMSSVRNGLEFLELMRSRRLKEAADYLETYQDRL